METKSQIRKFIVYLVVLTIISSLVLNIKFNFSENYAKATQFAAAENNLQTRIDEAQDGETIKVPAGTYSGPIRVKSNITIEGEGTIKHNGNSAMFITEPGTENVTFKNIKITGSGNVGFELDSPINIRVENSEVSGHTYGYLTKIGRNTQEYMQIINSKAIDNEYGFSFERKYTKAFSSPGGFVVSNSIGDGNKFNFYGLTAYDITIENCESKNAKSDGWDYNFDYLSKRIHVVNSRASYNYDGHSNSSDAFQWAMDEYVTIGRPSSSSKRIANLNGTVPRKEALLAYYRMADREGDREVDTNYVTKFPDYDVNDMNLSVPYEAEQVAAIDWAYNIRNMIDGNLRSDGTIKLDKDRAVTRAEMISFLWKFAGRPSVSGNAAQGKVIEWAEKEFSWAMGEGIVPSAWLGKTGNNYNCQEILKRYEMFELLQAYSNKTTNTFPLTYNLQGGTVSGNPTTYVAGKSVTIKAPTKEGYTFGGWTGSSYNQGNSSNEQERGIQNNQSRYEGRTDSSKTTLTMSNKNTGNKTLTATWIKDQQPVKQITIKYDGNGATSGSTAPHTVDQGEQITLRNNGFTRDGYTFKGWNTKPDGTGVTYNPGQKQNFNEDTTLYAIWEKNPDQTPEKVAITLTYNPNGGEGTPYTESTQVNKGTSVTKTVLPVTNGNINFTRDGYTFKGWNTKPDGTGVTYNPNSNITFDKDTTLYAIWEKNPDQEPEKVTIGLTYDPNGGEGTPYTEGARVDKGTPVTKTVLPVTDTNISFIRPGYTFKGWNTKPDGTGVTYNPNSNITFDKNTTLYAIWEKNPEKPEENKSLERIKTVKENRQYKLGEVIRYTVTVKNTGNVDRTNITVEDNNSEEKIKTIDILKVGEVKEVEFTHIVTAADIASGKVVNTAIIKDLLDPEGKPTNTVTVPTEDQKPETISIIYDKNAPDAIGSTDPHTNIAKGSEVTLRDNGYTRSGYEFVGWNTKPDGTGITYKPGQNKSFDSDMTLYAIWKKKPVTVTFDPAGGTGTMDPQEFEPGVPNNLNKNTYTRDGYTFKGWRDESGKTYTDGELSSFDKDTTLYAVWEKTANVNDGSKASGKIPQTGVNGMSEILVSIVALSGVAIVSAGRYLNIRKKK